MSWRKKYRDQLQAAKTDAELNAIIGHIYEEGFEDGVADEPDGDKMPDPIPWDDLD